MKKIISLILAVSIVMTSFVNVFASNVVLDADKVIEGIFKFDVGDFVQGSTTSDDAVIDPDVKRINFLTSLGIWDNAQKPKDSLVSITELSVIMARLKLGATNALEGVYTLPENTNNKNATYKDAYTMIVSALGYDYKFKGYQDAEQGALLVAAELGLISSNPANVNAYITRNDLAKLVEKALLIDICEMENTNGGYKYVVSNGVNLLNKVHSIYDISGFVNAIPGISVYGSTNVKDGYIQINRRNVNTSGLDLLKYFGNYVTAFAKFDEATNKYSIVYIDYAKENINIEIDFSQISHIKNNTLFYEKDGVEEEVELDALKYVTQNGTTLNSISDMVNFKEKQGKIIFSTSDKYEEIDVARIYVYSYATLEYNDSIDKKIGFKFQQSIEGYGQYILIDDNDIVRAYLNGVLVNYETLPINSAIKFFRQGDYVEIHASNETASGSVEMMYDNNVVISGKEYKISNDLLDYIEYCKNNSVDAMNMVNPIVIGTNGTFFSVDGVITGYTYVKDYAYGWLKAAYLTRTALDPEITLRIFTEEASWITVPVAKKLEVDGVSGVKQSDFINLISNNQDVIVDELIRYKLNSEGQLTGIDTILEVGGEVYTTDDVKFDYKYSGSLDHTIWFLGINVPYYIGANSPIFVIPDNRAKEDEYKINKTSSLQQNVTYELYLYSVDEFLQSRVIVVYGTGAQAESENSIHVEKITKVVLEDDEYAYKVSGKQYVNLRARAKGEVKDISVYIEEEKFEANPISVGDFINVSFAGKFVDSWIIDYPGGVVPATDSITKMGSFLYKIVGEIDKMDLANDIVILNVNGAKTLVVPRAKGVINTSTNKTIAAKLSDFHPGDRVCVMMSYSHGQYMFKNSH